MRNRRGKILIDRNIYMKQPENCSKALAEIGFLPLRVECLAMTDKFELVGYAAAFDEVDDCVITPEYRLAIELDENGEYERASLFSFD